MSNSRKLTVRGVKTLESMKGMRRSLQRAASAINEPHITSIGCFPIKIGSELQCRLNFVTTINYCALAVVLDTQLYWYFLFQISGPPG